MGLCNSAPTQVVVKVRSISGLAFSSTPGSARVLCPSTPGSKVPGSLLLELRGISSFRTPPLAPRKPRSRDFRKLCSPWIGPGNSHTVEKVEGAANQIHPSPVAWGEGGVHPVLCLFSAMPPPCEASHCVKDSSTFRSQFSCWTRVCDHRRRRLFVKLGHINSNLRTGCSCQQGSTATWL